MNSKNAVLGLLLLLVWFGACADSSPCDDDQVLRLGYCHPVDAASPLADTDATSDEVLPTFGRACSSAKECVAPTTYCALQPGKSTGFCSAFGCDLDPTICPAGWSCMDLTPYGMAAHMCIPSS